MTSYPDRLSHAVKVLLNTLEDGFSALRPELADEPFLRIIVVFAAIARATQRNNVTGHVARIAYSLISNRYPVILLWSLAGLTASGATMLEKRLAFRPVFKSEARWQIGSKCAASVFSHRILCFLLSSLLKPLNVTSVLGTGHTSRIVAIRLSTISVKKLIACGFYFPAMAATLKAIRRFISPFARCDFATDNTRSADITKTIGALFVSMKVFSSRWKKSGALYAVFEAGKRRRATGAAFLRNIGGTAVLTTIYQTAMSRTAEVIRSCRIYMATLRTSFCGIIRGTHGSHTPMGHSPAIRSRAGASLSLDYTTGNAV